MLQRLVPGALAVLAGLLGLQCAGADVYTWTDEAGRVNVSNLAPPEGARVTSIVPSPPKSEAREEAARDAARRAEIAALNDRVAKLQDQLEQSRRDAAIPAAYPVPPPVAYASPASPQYASWAPPVVPYVVDAPLQTAVGCGYAWNDCGAGWGTWSSPYFANVVVFRDKGIHRVRPARGNFRQPGHGARPVVPRPGRAPWDPRR